MNKILINKKIRDNKYLLIKQTVFMKYFLDL